MAFESRRAALCDQNPLVLTGIDFVQVVNPADQRVLRVFFIVEPDQLVPPLATAADLGNLSNGAPNVSARIVAVHGGAEIPVTRKDWLQVPLDSLVRVCLELQVEAPGGFEPYHMLLDHLVPESQNQLDPFLGECVFDFKQGCETGFDCQEEDRCLPEAGVDFAVDYLARDFGSFRRALLDFAAQRYPEWREPIEADMGVMLLEIMAQLGDEFAYTQDRYDAETRFGSATQRASIEALARLVDYDVDRGRPAQGEIVLTALAGPGGDVNAGAVVWALGDSAGPIPFSLDEDLWVHKLWNAVKVHDPDPEILCLARGRNELLLALNKPALGEVPDDPDNPGNPMPLADFLGTRRAMILSDPADAEWPKRGWPVTISAVEEFDDVLLGQHVVRIRWDEADATPFDLPYDGLSVALNVAPATAGRPVTEYVRAGDDGDVDSVYAGMSPRMRAKLRAMPPLIEREGPWRDAGRPSRYAPDAGIVGDPRDERAIVMRYGLAATENASLRFHPDGRPPVAVEELIVVEPGTLPVNPFDLFESFAAGGKSWSWTDDLLEADAADAVFTAEPGMWRTVKTYQLPFGDFAFRDYAGNDGWTLKFGFGDLGDAPNDGTLLRVRYFTDPGPAANVASFAIGLTPPDGGAPDPGFNGRIAAAVNPLPFANARGEESSASVRLNAPQQYRARPHRAVRPEDYSAIIEREPWVQKAHAVTRWTGSWSTDFVAVDPKKSIAITPEQRGLLAAEIDCIRMVTRDARPVDARYLDVDIEVVICVDARAYAGEVIERVRDAIAPPGFFDPDNFTFGQPLIRSALEAAVQRVPGVAHVETIAIRIHGVCDWRPFDEAELPVDADTIVRLQNDPDRSTLGLLRIKSAGGM
jgi:hypothetical protein